MALTILALMAQAAETTQTLAYHPPLWIYPVLTVVAVVTGFVDSVAGGGGLIMMPVLFTLGLPPHITLGTNKLQSMCGTAMATFRYYRAGLFTLSGNLVLLGVTFAGALAGTMTIQHFDGRVLALVVPVLLIGVSLYTVLSPRMDDTDRHDRVGQRGFLPVASAIGFYDGFFGPGTGQFFTTGLVALRGLGLTRATGLTKLLNLTSNLAGVILFALGGQILWVLALCMACGSMCGAWMGTHFATRLGARLIRPLLITVSLGLTGRLLWGWFAG